MHDLVGFAILGCYVVGIDILVCCNAVGVLNGCLAGVLDTTPAVSHTPTYHPRSLYNITHKSKYHFFSLVSSNLIG